MVAGENAIVKRKPPAKKPPRKEPPINVSGIKFEDGLRIMLNTPPLRTLAKPRK